MSKSSHITPFAFHISYRYEWSTLPVSGLHVPILDPPMLARKSRRATCGRQLRPRRCSAEQTADAGHTQKHSLPASPRTHGDREGHQASLFGLGRVFEAGMLQYVTVLQYVPSI